MMRSVPWVMAVMATAAATSWAGDQDDDQAQLAGSWEITLIVDDGRLVPEAEIRRAFIKDARLSIQGQTVHLQSPTEKEPRELPFVLGPKSSPKTIDLADARKTGSKSIYLVS